MVLQRSADKGVTVSLMYFVYDAFRAVHMTSQLDQLWHVVRRERSGFGVNPRIDPSLLRWRQCRVSTQQSRRSPRNQARLVFRSRRVFIHTPVSVVTAMMLPHPIRRAANKATNKFVHSRLSQRRLPLPAHYSIGTAAHFYFGANTTDPAELTSAWPLLAVGLGSEVVLNGSKQTGDSLAFRVDQRSIATMSSNEVCCRMLGGCPGDNEEIAIDR